MFDFMKSLSGENFPPIEMVPTTPSEAYTIGEALVVTNGKLTKAGATAKPQYFAAKSYVAPASGNEDLPVNTVLPNHEYEAPFAANASAISEGAAVTLHTDGLQITATTTGGVATIVKKLGSGAVGTLARVRFI
jgi:hypothetical protein